jgi:D-alanyl-D-alanine carboxypeptidase (penicillin-binding protein 5/6)
MKRKIIALLLLSLCFFSFLAPMTVRAADYESEAPLSSESAAVFNVNKGILVYGQEAHAKVSPGSTVKIMTALMALEYFEGRLDTVITVPAAALRGLEGGAVLNLKADEQISVNDLIHATLIAGMNDAANTLALAIGGTLAKFTAMMNEKARNLGAANTFYMNPTGLSSAAYTTAYDTAKICAYAYENDLFMEISSKRAYTVPATNLHDAVTIYTRNSFLTPKSEYYYSYAEGICTGYSNTDGAQLACAASNGNYEYVCVSFGSKKDENGTIAGYAEVKSLLNWASSNFAEKKILDKSQIICELPVRAGKDVAHVLIVPYQSLYSFLDKDTDLSRITLSRELYYEKLDAPVQKGDCVGMLTVMLDGLPMGTTPLITKSTVRQSASGKLFLFLESIVTSKFFIISTLLSLAVTAFRTYTAIKRKRNRKHHPVNKPRV